MNTDMYVNQFCALHFTCKVIEPLLSQFIGSEGPYETGEHRLVAGPATHGGCPADLHSGSSVAYSLPAEFLNLSWASLLEVRALARLGNTALWRVLPPTVAVQRISILEMRPPPLLVKWEFWIWKCSPTVLVCSPCESISSAPSWYSHTDMSAWNNNKTPREFDWQFDGSPTSQQRENYRYGFLAMTTQVKGKLKPNDPIN
jgi:hypothetical protein